MFIRHKHSLDCIFIPSILIFLLCKARHEQIQILLMVYLYKYAHKTASWILVISQDSLYDDHMGNFILSLWLKYVLCIIIQDWYFFSLYINGGISYDILTTPDIARTTSNGSPLAASASSDFSIIARDAIRQTSSNCNKSTWFLFSG